MPHNSHSSHSRHGASSGDDLGSTDEIKIFKDEGDREDDKISSENLLVEEKSSLIDLTESEEKSGKITTLPDPNPVFNKIEPSTFNMGYLVSPYTYSNGATGGLPVTMANKIGLPPFFCHNGDPLTTPPPAHCGIPPYQLDPKAMGLTRPPIYPFPSSQYPYPMLSPDISQVASWHTPSVYSASSSFRSPYPSSLPINTTLSSDFSFRFSPSLLPSVHTSPHHVLNSHSALVTPGPKQDIGQDSAANHRYSRNLDTKSSLSSQGNECKDNSNDKKKTHIKKPLNAFMLYMKEMRAKVVAECTLKESAAINQILGRRWHELTREEQSKYYEKARQERQLHMELYPGWSARDNYGYVSKKKKRKKDRSPADSGDPGNNMKKCRARFGLDQQNQWCKPCRRKKKCIRYMESLGGGDNQDLDDLDAQISDDHLGSCGSIDDAKTPEDDNESLNQSLSSPRCLSGLSSLQSPSTSLASPLNLLASPATPAAATAAIIMPNEQQQQQMHMLQAHHISQTAAVAAAAAAAQQSMIQKQHHRQQHLFFNQQQQSLKQQAQPQQQLPAASIFGSSSSSSNNTDVAASPTTATTSMLPLTSLSTSHIAAASSAASGAAKITSATTSTPAESADRMMMSLLNGSPAALLGNSLSHLAMGLSNTVQSDLQTQLMQKAAVSAANNTKTVNGYSGNSLELATSVRDGQTQSSVAMLETISNMDAITATNQGCLPMASSNALSNFTSSSPPSSTASSPAASDVYLEKSKEIRNPVGANPHDINNPLSINQLTKRGSSGKNSCNAGKLTENNNSNPTPAANSANAATNTKSKSSSSVMASSLHAPIATSTTQYQQQHDYHAHQQQQQGLHNKQIAQQQFQQQSHLPHLNHPPPFFGNNISQHFQHFNHHLAAAAAAAASSGVHIPAVMVCGALGADSNCMSVKNNAAEAAAAATNLRPRKSTAGAAETVAGAGDSGAISVT